MPGLCHRYIIVLLSMTLFAFGAMISYLVIIGDNVSVRGAGGGGASRVPGTGRLAALPPSPPPPSPSPYQLLRIRTWPVQE